jgi:small-conductance mechanosensitive channel
VPAHCGNPTSPIVIIFTVGALVSGAIRTDLAIAILHAFAEAGIAIPSGRAKITIRNLDGSASAATDEFPANLRR